MEDGTKVDDESLEYLPALTVLVCLKSGELYGETTVSNCTMPPVVASDTMTDNSSQLPVQFLASTSSLDSTVIDVIVGSVIQQDKQPSSANINHGLVEHASAVMRDKNEEKEKNGRTQDSMILDALMKHPKGAWIKAEAQKQIVCDEARKKLVRAACSHLIDLASGSYPSSEMKTKMAQSIVGTFPSLKSPTGEGHEHYYSVTGGGYLQNRFRTIQRELPQEEKKYKKRKIPDCCLEQPNDVEEDDELIVATMQNLLPLVANRDRIFQLMRESFPARRQWIKDTNPTVLAILTRYPRFTDTAGLLQQEFAMMKLSPTDNAAALYESTSARKVMKYCLQAGLCLDQVKDFESLSPDDMARQATLCLVQLLPTMGKNRVSYATAAPLLLEDVNPGESLDDYLGGLESSNRKLSRFQPYIICCGNAYYIICDGKALLVSPPRFSTAIADLMAVYFAFNTSYPKQLENFFHFVEVFIFNLKRKLPARATTLLSDIMKL